MIRQSLSLLGRRLPDTDHCMVNDKCMWTTHTQYTKKKQVYRTLFHFISLYLCTSLEEEVTDNCLRKSNNKRLSQAFRGQTKIGAMNFLHFSTITLTVVIYIILCLEKIILAYVSSPPPECHLALGPPESTSEEISSGVKRRGTCNQVLTLNII